MRVQFLLFSWHGVCEVSPIQSTFQKTPNEHNTNWNWTENVCWNYDLLRIFSTLNSASFSSLARNSNWMSCFVVSTYSYSSSSLLARCLHELHTNFKFQHSTFIFLFLFCSNWILFATVSTATEIELQS